MPKFVHIDISADDPDRAAKFYQSVFGWQVQKLEGPVPYWLVAVPGGDGVGAGIGQRDQPWQSVAPTIEVPSVDDFVERIERAGGSIVQPKTMMPGVGYLAAFRDTEGNILTVLEPTGAATGVTDDALTRH